MSLALASRRAAISPSWVRNALWRNARAVPSLDLQFADTKSLTDAISGQNLITFTRASSATYVGSDGLIKTAATNEPRFDHNPTTGESLGVLVQEQRTNLLSYSEDFGTSWGLASATRTLDVGVAPNGTTTADRIESTGGGVFRAGVGVANTTAYTYSVFLKHVSGTGVVSNVGFERFGAVPLAAQSSFNIQTGVVVSNGAAVTSSSITPFGDGWYRVSVTATSTDVTTTVIDYASASGNQFLIWGAQLEAGATPSSYIPTTTATATRSADVATDTTRGAALRTLYAQFRNPASGTRPIVSLDDNTANDRIELFTSGTDPKLLVTDNGSAQADLDAGTIAANTTARLAGRFNSNDFAASVSGGVEVVDSTGTMPTVDRIRIGRDQAGNYLNGTIARIAGWDAPLSTISQITQ